jgi:succinoglycan biosynthesis protein ExoO
MNGSPDVSVIIPAWKAGAFIGRAVASALASTDVSVEVIVVDDASPDDTFEILKSLAAADSRVRSDRLAINGGPSAARNRAIELASGTFIAILDADDTMDASRLARMTAEASRTDADIVVDNMIEVDADGRRISELDFLRSGHFYQPRAIDIGMWIDFNRPMKQGDCLGYLKPLIRRATLEKTGIRYDASLRNSEDYYLVAHLLALGAVMHYLPLAGYNYTRAAGSTSHRLKPSDTASWLVAEQSFQARYERDMRSRDRGALAERMRLLRDVDTMVRSIEALKARKPLDFARLLKADPHGGVFTLGWLARIAGRKLTGARG